MVLIGYIPVAKLAWITDPNVCRTKKWELYHAAMGLIMEPLKTVSREGIEMRCADGGVRRVHPVAASHIGDWPEICTVGCTNITRCPTCVAPFQERGHLGHPAHLRTKAQTLRAMELGQQGYIAQRVGLGLRPMLPYWWDHPWASGPASIGPDLLHQLWKGVYLTHIFNWWTRLLGARELDRRYMGLLRYSGHRHFTVGISPITQWTGNEARASARAFLPIVADSRTHSAVRAARCVTDFMYRARMPQLDEDDLHELDADLAEFHDHKDIFRAKRVHTSRYGFNGIAKLHVLRHYTHYVREMGTPDGYSTEGPERLHIDYVKRPYHATNSVNPEPKMTTYLQREEGWDFLRYDLEGEGIIQAKQRRRRPEEEPIEDDWVDVDDESEDEMEVESEGIERNSSGAARRNGLWVRGVWRGPIQPRAKDRRIFRYLPQLEYAKRPTFGPIQCSMIIRHHQTPTFVRVVKDYVKQFSANHAFLINERARFGVWSRFTLRHDPLPFAPLVGRKSDLVCATPAIRDQATGMITQPAFFDTVLLEEFGGYEGLYREYTLFSC